MADAGPALNGFYIYIYWYFAYPRQQAYPELFGLVTEFFAASASDHTARGCHTSGRHALLKDALQDPPHPVELKIHPGPIEPEGPTQAKNNVCCSMFSLLGRVRQVPAPNLVHVGRPG